MQETIFFFIAHSLNNRILRGFHSLVKTKYQFHDKSRATDNVMYSKHAIRDCESLCLSDETVKAVGPFYLVSMPGEVKDPTQGVNV